MRVLTGAIRNRLVHIGCNETWRQVELLNCVICAGPKSNFDSVSNVAFMDCTFLYDGMEVNSFEWIALMRRGPEFGLPLPPH